MGKKPLDVPVFDHLDKLSDYELQFYYDYWLEKKQTYQRSLDNATKKFECVLKEKMRRSPKKHWGTS